MRVLPTANVFIGDLIDIVWSDIQAINEIRAKQLCCMTTSSAWKFDMLGTPRLKSSCDDSGSECSCRIVNFIICRALWH